MGMEFLKSSDKNSAQKSSWPPFDIDFALQLEFIPTLNHLQSKVIYTKYSKQFKWNSHFYVFGQNWPFWAALKLL